MTPKPPLLFIRPKLAFWTESEWNATSLTTLQGFREGCFENTWCLDSDGQRWPIAAASLLGQATLLHKFLPWRRLPVALTLGSPTRVTLGEVVEALCEILSHPDADFPFALAAPPTSIQARLKNAQSIPELISIADSCSRRAA